MELEEKLRFLQNEDLCDENLVKTLLVDNDFLVRTVSEVHSQYDSDKDNYYLGDKLLFLEELFSGEEEVRDRVIDWMRDPKRMFLFQKSSQGALYGELLMARAGGALMEFREDYNLESSSQLSFEYGKSKVIAHTVDRLKEQDPKELIERKLDAVLNRTYEHDKEILERFLDRDKLREFILSNAGEGMKKLLLDRDYGKWEKDEDGYLEGVDAVNYFLSEKNGSIDELLNNELNNASYISIKIEKSLDLYHNKWDGNLSIDSIDFITCENHLEDIVNGITEKLLRIVRDFEDYSNKRGAMVKDQFFNGDLIDAIYHESDLNNHEVNELRSLREEYETSEGARDLSSKLRRDCRLAYSFALSGKDPLDVRMGNDSGCCIGIYENSDNIGNGYSLPHLIADNATYIFDIMQQINEGKKRRTGIVLAFDTHDEDNNRVLACNSLELSPSMNPMYCVEDIVGFVEEGLMDFALNNGFSEVLMSNHSYNTSQNYSSRKGRKPANRVLLRKPHSQTEPKFYSEILDDDKTCDVNSRSFYQLFP
jgi:hypothetical protein|tara:strand:+ start:730 stop:2340 length:1611 start_codon:yes stop_codon:yes gene_type:complete